MNAAHDDFVPTRFSTDLRGRAVIVAADGDVDTFDAPRLRDALTLGEILVRRDVIVDLSRAHVVSARAFGVLEGLAEQFRHERRRFVAILPPRLAAIAPALGYAGELAADVDSALAPARRDVA